MILKIKLVSTEEVMHKIQWRYIFRLLWIDLFLQNMLCVIISQLKTLEWPLKVIHGHLLNQKNVHVCDNDNDTFC